VFREQSSSFNGAAAKSSGKSSYDTSIANAFFASMGPPLKAAENRIREERERLAIEASMGPPLKAAEN